MKDEMLKLLRAFRHVRPDGYGGYRIAHQDAHKVEEAFAAACEVLGEPHWMPKDVSKKA